MVELRGLGRRGVHGGAVRSRWNVIGQSSRQDGRSTVGQRLWQDDGRLSSVSGGLIFFKKNNRPCNRTA